MNIKQHQNMGGWCEDLRRWLYGIEETKETATTKCDMFTKRNEQMWSQIVENNHFKAFNRMQKVVSSLIQSALNRFENIWCSEGKCETRKVIQPLLQIPHKQFPNSGFTTTARPSNV